MSSRGYVLGESELNSMLLQYGRDDRKICGIDEAGRGALAGPVVAAAVVFVGVPIDGLADSKVLSKKRREKLFDELQSTAIIGIGIVQQDVIDRINILQANFLAMQAAITSVESQGGFQKNGISMILVDGNYLTDDIQRQCAGLGVPIGAVIKGDSKVAEISAASIVAKVTRDRIMHSADAQFPGYGFAINAGYPSPSHLSSLRAIGACSIHRQTFGPVASVLAT